MCNNIIGRKLFAANSVKGVALRAPIVGGACESQSALGIVIILGPITRDVRVSYARG